MSARNREILWRLTRGNRWLLLVNVIVLSVACVDELSELRGTDLGIASFALSVLANHYYILYGMLPLLMLVIARYLRGIRTVEKIRYQNVFSQIRHTTGAFITWLALYLLAHIVISAGLYALLFPHFAALTPLPPTLDGGVALLAQYRAVFPSSALALLAAAGYMLFGFLVLLSLLSYLNAHHGYRAMIGVALAIYALTFVGFRVVEEAPLPVLFFNQYILLHHALFAGSPGRLVAVVSVGLLIIFYCFGVHLHLPKRRRAFVFNAWLLNGREWALTLALPPTILLLEMVRNSTVPDVSLREIVAETFLGSGVLESAFGAWARMALFYLAPLFFIGAANTRLSDYSQAAFLIRFQNAATVRYQVTKQYVWYLLAYVLVLAVTANGLFLFGAPVGENDLFQELFGQPFTLGTLNLFLAGFALYLLFDFVLFQVLGRFFGSLAAWMLLLALKLMLFFLPQWNVLHANFGVVHLFEGGQTPASLVVFAVAVLYFVFIISGRFRHGHH